MKTAQTNKGFKAGTSLHKAPQPWSHWQHWVRATKALTITTLLLLAFLTGKVAASTVLIGPDAVWSVTDISDPVNPVTLGQFQAPFGSYPGYISSSGDFIGANTFWHSDIAYLAFGTTSTGGQNGYGTIFSLDSSGTLTSLHDFNGTDGDGPSAELTLFGHELYGTTASTIFKIDVDGSNFQVLHNTGSKVGLIVSAGVLYGATDSSLFKVETNGDNFTTLRSSVGPGVSELVLSNGVLYGTTHLGGTQNVGTIFKINTDGTGYSVLKSFSSTGTEGFSPDAGLAISGNNKLYGTTAAGGAHSHGTVFAINTDGTGFTTLYSFQDGTDGNIPLSQLLLSGNTLYGTTQGDPSSASPNSGTVFKINTDGTAFTVLKDLPANQSSGFKPNGKLSLFKDALFDTTVGDDLSTFGSVFKVNTDGTSFTSLSSFATNGSGNLPSGGLPLAGVCMPFVDNNCGSVWSLDTKLNLTASQAALATYSAAVDNHYDIYVNGVLAASLCTGGTPVWAGGPLGNLHAGQNDIRVVISDGDGSCSPEDSGADCLDYFAMTVTSVDASYGTISTVVGNPSLGGTYSGDGGNPLSAGLNVPTGLTFDSQGNLFIADSYNAAVREVSGNVITSPVTGYFSWPSGVAVDANLNLYVANADTDAILEFQQSDTPGVFVSTPIFLQEGNLLPQSLTIDGFGNLYFVDEDGDYVGLLDPFGDLLTYAGTGQPGYSGDGDSALNATLSLDNYFLLPSGDGGLTSSVVLDSSGNMYIADTGNNVVREVLGGYGGEIITVAGNHDLGAGYSGDNASATDAQLSSPTAVAVDSSGNLYIADTGNNVIRKVDVNGVITTFAGNGTASYSGDGGPANAASLNAPSGLTFDSSGNLYISDTGNDVIRKVALIP